MFKYIAKGFDAIVPGACRKWFREPGPLLRGDSSWRALYAAEAFVIEKRHEKLRRFGNGNASLTSTEARAIALVIGVSSDYAEDAKLSGRLPYIVRAIARAFAAGRRVIVGLAWAFACPSLVPPPAAIPPEVPMPPAPRCWRDSGDLVAATADKRNPQLHLLYDYDKIATMA